MYIYNSARHEVVFAITVSRSKSKGETMTTLDFALVAFVLWIAVIAVHAEGFSLPSTPPNQPPSSPPSPPMVPLNQKRYFKVSLILLVLTLEIEE